MADKGGNLEHDPHGVARQLADARAGSREALGQALEACRRYLLAIADRQLAPDLQAKGGASDIVQQTFLEAQRDFARFHGDSDAEWRAWLRQLLIHNLSNFRRHYRATDMRQVEREIGLNAVGNSTNPGMEVAASDPTPSRAAIQREETEDLQRALDSLPEELRQVIALRQHDQLTFEEIARRLNRSVNGARTLWLRAVERLARELDSTDARG